MSASIDSGAVVSEEKNNKCALKLLGIDLEDLKDEEILEFISNYVQPSAIKSLFYDSFNCFYVLHLSDIESTCLLVGKTLQISCYRVHFLPLFECFVIGNVYMSVTNNDLRNIFSMFGNVFEVKNYHVLPNSLKFCHVLSGTREISFLLPGEDIDVTIPVNVIYKPYTFHVRQLCLGCLTQGHSLLNCPDREDVESSSLPSITHIAGNLKDALNENSLVIKQEILISVSEDSLKEKFPEVDERATLSRELNRLSKKQGDSQEVEEEMSSSDVSEEENSLLKKKRTSQEMSEIALNGISLVSEEENSLLKKKRTSQEMSEIALNGISQVNEETNPNPIPSTEKHVQESGPSRCFFRISPLLEKWIQKVDGVLLPHDMIELIQIDARNRRNVISFVSNFTTNFKVVASQLKKILRKYSTDTHFDSVEYKYKRKLLTLIKVLIDFKNK